MMLTIINSNNDNNDKSNVSDIIISTILTGDINHKLP